MAKRTKRSYQLAAAKGRKTRLANERKRSQAARKGWATRRKNERAKTRKRAVRKLPGAINHILTITVKTRRNGRVRSFSRDIIIPAPRGSSQANLIAIAQRTLPKREQYAASWYATKGRTITIAEGPATRGKKAHLR